MANEEQLAILMQGVKAWNSWIEEHLDEEIDPGEVELVEARFTRPDLSGAKLTEADLTGVYLHGANLSKANLEEAYLTGADLSRANLSEANLGGADLEEADLAGANLSGADLEAAHLDGADLSGANLSGARLYHTNLCRATLIGADLRGSTFWRAGLEDTIIATCDMSEVIGLEGVVHLGPSHLSISTLARSKGHIPEIFLRGCGLSDWEIELAKLYDPDLSNDQRSKILYRSYDLQSTQAIQISPLFISYAHADSEFVDKVGGCLQDKGVRYWRDIHDMKAGRIEKQIDRAIRQSPTVLLVLSEHSLKSDWVEHEVRIARVLEKDMGRDMLCPVALDDGWKSSPWPKRVMEQIMEYNILDFSEWRDDGKFVVMFHKLIDGLELFYEKG